MALNLANVIPGRQGGVELMQLELARLESVWDPISTRVQQLCELVVNAS